MAKRYKARERDRLIETVRASGEPVKLVAKQLGVKESTAYYWMRRARRAEPPKFARVIPTAQTSKASLSIVVGGVVIRLDEGFDAALLREVVAALNAWSRPFSVEEFARRREAEVLGTKLYIASAEDVILSKLEWAKMAESERQITDVAGIVRTQGTDIDVAYVERWVAELELQSEWTRASAEAGLTSR